MNEKNVNSYIMRLLRDTDLSMEQIEQKTKMQIDKCHNLIDEETALFCLIREYNLEEEKEMEQYRKGTVVFLSDKDKNGNTLQTRSGKKYWKMGIMEDNGIETLWFNIFDKSQKQPKDSRVLFQTEQKGQYTNLTYLAVDKDAPQIQSAAPAPVLEEMVVKDKPPVVDENLRNIMLSQLKVMNGLMKMLEDALAQINTGIYDIHQTLLNKKKGK